MFNKHLYSFNPLPIETVQTESGNNKSSSGCTRKHYDIASNKRKN